jgi:HK97 family phage major capsid protein
MTLASTSIYSAFALALLIATATATKNQEELPATVAAPHQNPATPKGEPDTQMAPGVRDSHRAGASCESQSSFKEIDMKDQYKKRLAVIQTRLGAIDALLAAENRCHSEAERAEYDTLTQEAKSFQASIELIEARESAVPAMPRGISAAPAILTKTTQAMRNGDKFQGQSFTRYALAMAAAHLRKCSVADVMQERFGRTRPELVKLARKWNAQGIAGVMQDHLEGRFHSADVAGGGTGGSDWGHELVQADGNYVGDFIELLRAKTVFDKLPLTVVPANVIIKGQDGTGTAYWVGEHKPIPMSAQDYSAVTLTPLKIGALTALSIELVQDSTPDAEGLATTSLVKDCAQLLDSKFFSTDAASAGVSPAGMLQGLSQVQSSAGADINGLINDTDALVQVFLTAKNPGGLHWVTLPSIAHKIAGFRGFAGNRLFEGLSEEGGTYDGKPMHVSDNVGAGDLILMKPSDVYRIGDRGLSVDVSTEATLEFGSAPTGAGDTPTDASENPVSLFQAGMIGIRVMRRINWAKRRTGAVQFIGNTAYAPQIVTA